MSNNYPTHRPKTGRFAAAFVRGAQVRNEVIETETRETLSQRHAEELANANTSGMRCITIHYPTGRSARGVLRGTARVTTLGGRCLAIHLNATREALEDLRDKTYRGAWVMWHNAKGYQP